MKKEIATYEEFLAEKKEGEVLVDFYATWCGPCKMLAPIVETIANEIPDLKVLSVDVDEIPEAAGDYGVQSIPTLIHFKDGKALDTHLGYAPKPVLMKFLGR